MKKLLVCLFFVIIALAIAEGGLRLAGFQPWLLEPIEDEITWKPNCPWNQDSISGIKLSKGDYKVTYNNQHTILLTNNEAGYRITSSDSIAANSTNKTRIKVFGDSFTQGCGLNNDETFCWLLQQKLPNCAVYNYGGPGYAIANIFSQMTKAHQPDSGDIYVFAYSTAQDYRFSHSVMKSLCTRPDLWEKVGILKLNSDLSTEFSPYHYEMWVLSPYSALVNLSENYWNDFLDARQSKQAHQISRLAVSYLNDYCKQRGAIFLLAAIDQVGAGDMLDHCKKQGIAYTDISVDVYDKKFNQRPYNDQPNAYANELYANRLFNVIYHPKFAELNSGVTTHH